MSYNCNDLNKINYEYIKSSSASCGTQMLQKHQLSDYPFNVLGDIDGKFSYAAVSGFGNMDILDGRPHGGCAILWHADTAAAVNILDTNCRLICILRLTNDKLNLLLCNYMPFEGSDDKTDESVELLSI